MCIHFNAAFFTKFNFNCDVYVHCSIEPQTFSLSFAILSLEHFSTLYTYTKRQKKKTKKKRNTSTLLHTIRHIEKQHAQQLNCTAQFISLFLPCDSTGPGAFSSERVNPLGRFFTQRNADSQRNRKSGAASIAARLSAQLNEMPPRARARMRFFYYLPGAGLDSFLSGTVRRACTGT